MGTSKLQEAVGYMLWQEFPGFDIHENKRPDWLLSSDLSRLELDFYLPDLRVAVEVQGRQHYEYTPYFHGDYDGFLQQKRRDQEKVDLCRGRGIHLITIDDLEDAITKLQRLKLSTARPSVEYIPTPFIPVNPPRGDAGAVDKWVRYAKQNSVGGDGSSEQKLDEIKKARKKFTRFFSNGGKGRQKRIPHFQFKHLNRSEIAAVLEEFGIQDLVVEFIERNG